MPYISVNVTKELTEAQKNAIKTGLGEKIGLIPGKAEAQLMVDISDQHTIYMAGERQETAYIEVKIYGEAAVEHKKALTEAVFAVVAEHTGLPEKGMYLTFSSFENWGTRGTLK